MINKLYHLDKLVINNVEVEWFDLNKAVNGDRWNEMTETEEEPESEPEIEIVKDLEPKVNPKPKTEAKTKTELEPKTEKNWADGADSMAMEFLFNHMDQVDWCGADVVMMLETTGAMDCCGLIMDAK